LGKKGYVVVVVVVVVGAGGLRVISFKIEERKEYRG